MSSYDLYKYISEYASTGISMALIDQVVYQVPMSQAWYSANLFAVSNVLTCYVNDMLMYNIPYQNILKPVVATIVYNWLYQNWYLTRYSGNLGNKDQNKILISSLLAYVSAMFIQNPLKGLLFGSGVQGV